MSRHAKIVCTLGPAVDSREKVEALMAAGMNVARINCSHGDWVTRAKWVSWIRQACGSVAPVAILVDLQGPKFRIGELRGGVLELRAGETVTVGRDRGCAISIPRPEIVAAMAPGGRLLLGDGNVELKIVSQAGDCFEARAVSGGSVKSRQGVTLVGKSFDVPVLTQQDVKDVVEAAKLGVDFVALSYVRSAADLVELRRLLDKHDPEIRMCAKVETRDAVREIGEIAKVTDLVMVARGDLGLQMDIEDVPMAQKKVVAVCATLGRPVIVATQMLESMLNSPRPTRAEASDVANAILDGADAVMLSGETAAGQYPIEAAKTMARLVEKAEGHFDHEARLSRNQLQVESTEAVAHAAVSLAGALRAKAVVTTTTSGLTPRLVSKFRPKMPILCAAWNERVRAQMAAVWGVEAILVDKPASTDDGVERAIQAFMKCRRLKVGDTVVITAGTPPGTAGGTNLVLVRTVG